MYNIDQITCKWRYAVNRSLLTSCILLVLGTWSFAGEVQIQTRELPQKEMLKQNREIVKLSSEELSKTLPQAVDKYTTLTKVEGKDTTLIYIFEINTGAKSDDTVRKEDRTRMQRAVTTGVCRSSKRFLDAQINISYVYISASSRAELFRFDISQEDCPRSDR